MRAEQDLAQLILRRHHLVRRAFVVRQLANERQNRGRIRRLRRANDKLTLCDLRHAQSISSPALIRKIAVTA